MRRWSGFTLSLGLLLDTGETGETGEAEVEAGGC